MGFFQCEQLSQPSLLWNGWEKVHLLPIIVHCVEGCPANEYLWFFGLSIPTPQRFEIVEPFVGQLIMQIFKREVKISNLYCCFRSISSPLLLSQTKFISNRKQCSTKKVRKPSGANISLSFVSFSFETNLDLKFHIFRQLQKWLSSVHQRLLDMKSWWQILKFWIGHLETIYLIYHTKECNCEPKQITFLFYYVQEKDFWRF